MSKVKRAPYVMYTPTMFFYYQELTQLDIRDNTLYIKYMDPYGKEKFLSRTFGFWNTKGAKEMYDEIIKVNNLNKERERHGAR